MIDRFLTWLSQWFRPRGYVLVWPVYETTAGTEWTGFWQYDPEGVYYR